MPPARPTWASFMPLWRPCPSSLCPSWETRRFLLLPSWPCGTTASPCWLEPCWPWASWLVSQVCLSSSSQHPAVESSLPVTNELLLLVSQSCSATPPQSSLGSTPTTYPRLCLPFLACACWERDWRWVQMKARKSWRRCRRRSRRRMKK